MIALPGAAIATVEPLHPAHHLLPARDQHYQRDEQEAVPKHKRDDKRVHRGPANTILPRADGRESAPRGTLLRLGLSGAKGLPSRSPASARATTSVAEWRHELDLLASTKHRFRGFAGVTFGRTLLARARTLSEGQGADGCGQWRGRNED